MVGVFGYSGVLLRRKNVGIDLFSRYVAVQVFSAPHSLTSVFGMGTGGPCAIKTPTFFFLVILSPFQGLYALNGLKISLKTV